MIQGKIKKWNSDRGFGFITPDEGGPDIFVHASEFESAGLDPPTEGDRIAYEMKAEQRSGKLAATRLQAV